MMPLSWLILYPIGLYATLAQLLIMGNPGVVTRERLGTLGRKP